MIPRATYRFQFHRDFTFADAAALVPYLDCLGISHLYASPITTARRGSMHGYDVVDPTSVNPELGGEEAFRHLVATLRAHGMGIIIDIVPNHMGISGGENAWWQNVLAKGQASPYARFFDIDWREKLLLPVLDKPLSLALADGSLDIREEEGRFILVAYGEQRFPIRDEDQACLPQDGSPAGIQELLDRQHYRLASWRTADDDLNWRRFFTINELAGLRVEDPEVFEATHRLYFRLYAEGLIDGVRIDHIDGLTDPAAYCRRLRARFDGIDRPDGTPPGPAYIVVEKILGRGERLARDWGTDGTSGYDFMEDVSAVLHDPDGEAPLTALWMAVSERSGDFEAEERTARQNILSWSFEGQLRRCVDAFVALAVTAPETEDFTSGMLRRAVERLLWIFPVYRTYGTGSTAPDDDANVRAVVRQWVEPFIPPGEVPVIDGILAWLAGEGPGDPVLAAEAVRQFQQLSAPIAAKAVEDTAFYRYGRLLSRNDVSFCAGRFSASVADFHAAQAERAATFPHSMLATATHDHKRGEDVRARLAVMSALPDAWRKHVEAWERLAEPFTTGIDPADRYMLYQMIFGAWPEGLDQQYTVQLSQYAERIIGWQRKALREAKLHSSWESPDETYESRCEALVRALLNPLNCNFLSDLERFVAWTTAPTTANMLVQTALRCTVPGVPDLYQGAELMDFTLVDPDNRGPVDYKLRQRLLSDASPAGQNGATTKPTLIARLLAMRQADPELFAQGRYIPLHCHGPRAGNILAFKRQLGRRALTCAFAIRCAPVLSGGAKPYPPGAWWGDTRIENIKAATLFAQSPVAITQRSG